jgi:chorismate lyase/3-hydroxybenzoate synthase
MSTANNAKSVPCVNPTAEQGFQQTVNPSDTSASLVPVGSLPSLIEQLPTAESRHVLGIVGYGQPLAMAADAPFPVLNVQLQPLEGEPLAEVWHSSEKPQQGTAGVIRYSNTSRLMFGCVELDCDRDLQTQTEQVYKELLSLVSSSGYPNLLRVWNHFPLINQYEDDLERYQLFCVGRHRAFQAHCGGGFQMQLPAASAIGTHGDKFAVHFIAATAPGIYLENPRQTSAYQYPKQYGPCSPSFARATLFPLGQTNKLILSGTASIVGYETLHPGEPEKQLEETLRNIDALLQHEAVIAQPHHNARFSNVKVYVRHTDDLPKIKSRVTEYFGEQSAILYLHGDICRSDLLLEIEGICDL